MMAQLANQLRAQLQQNPSARVPLIVRVSGDLSQAADQMCARGWTIKRELSLISGLAVEGPAGDALTLANEDWVQSIEEDKIVHTM